MSEDWDWKLTDRSKRQFEAHSTNTLAIGSSPSLRKLSPISGESRQITSNRSRERHIRSFGLDSSASDAVPIVNNEYWLC